MLGDVRVGVQLGQEPSELVQGDAKAARWRNVRTVVDGDGARDFRGPAVHGVRGERFVYLTWGNVGPDGSFLMFRRAKLMLNRVDPELLSKAAAGDGALVGTVRLTDDRGGPRCARIDPPAISWALG